MDVGGGGLGEDSGVVANQSASSGDLGHRPTPSAGQSRAPMDISVSSHPVSASSPNLSHDQAEWKWSAPVGGATNATHLPLGP